MFNIKSKKSDAGQQRKYVKAMRNKRNAVVRKKETICQKRQFVLRIFTVLRHHFHQIT
jgi:hypothetical protein